MTENPSPLEAIRLRPGMYFAFPYSLFGFIQYLVSSIDICIASKATIINLDIEKDQFTISTNVPIEIQSTDEKLIPFEDYLATNLRNKYHINAMMLCALSAYLYIETIYQDELWSITYEFGKRKKLERNNSYSNRQHISRLIFKPDRTILKSDISLSILNNHLQRNSFLNPDIKFHLTYSDFQKTYHAPDGLYEMFQTICAPYQIMHEPIHIKHTQDGLQLELIFAFHSWEEKMHWVFINNMKTLRNGTPEAGLTEALLEISEKCIPKKECYRENGFLAVMSLKYLDVRWAGSWKLEVNNPELHILVKSIVTEQASKAIKNDEDTIQKLKNLVAFNAKNFGES